MPAKQPDVVEAGYWAVIWLTLAVAIDTGTMLFFVNPWQAAIGQIAAVAAVTAFTILFLGFALANLFVVAIGERHERNDDDERD